MTDLEHTLLGILQSIEGTAVDAGARTALVQRKLAICAALSAPEQAWHDPSEAAPLPAPQVETTAVMPLVA